jgi:hypothetical protein
MKIGCLIGILPLLSGLLPGQTAPQRGLALAQDNLPFLSPLSGRMRWTGNRLAGCDYCEGNHPIVWAVDRQGNREAVALDIPDAGYLGVRDVASGPDGSLTTVGLAISGDSRMGTFIAWISPDSARQAVTRVWPYDPEVVTVASDGTIWTVGAMSNDNHVVVYPNVLRHYTPSGQLLASTLITGVRKNSGGLYNVSNTSTLMASNDRIGWLTMTCQYIEFSFDAVQLGSSYTCPNGYKRILDVGGVALSSANELLVGGKWPASTPPLELDRDTGTWKPVPVSKDPGNTRRLLGFDGLTLVTLATSALPNGPGPTWMRRYTWSDGPSGSQ